MKDLLRNRELEVTEVTGFVIPTTKFSCPIFEVTVKWIKEDVRFKSSLKLLTKEQFVSRLLDVGKLQETIIKKLHRNDEHRFFLPINAKVLFGEGAFQLPSGQSIVVATTNNVYKLIIGDSDFKERLTKWYMGL